MPTKNFIPASQRAVCHNMKRVTLEKVLWALEEMSPEVRVPEEIRLKAKTAVDKMLVAPGLTRANRASLLRIEHMRICRMQQESRARKEKIQEEPLMVRRS